MDDLDVGPYRNELEDNGSSFDDFKFSDGKIRSFVSFQILPLSLYLEVLIDDDIDISTIMDEYWQTIKDPDLPGTPQSMFCS
jgi:hypothetical protein